MIIFVLAMSISPSGYFTYGDFSNGAKSYSLATYWTLEYKKNHFLFAYDNFLEESSLGSVRQNLFSLGYTREILHLLGIRGAGFYISDSDDNVSRTFSTRVLYGYNPVFALGYAISSYSKQWESRRKIYMVYQIAPEYRVFVFKRGWFITGLHYTNAESENYLSLSSSLSLNIVPKFSIRVGGMYGERFYYVDDELLIVNNQPQVEKKRIGTKLNYELSNNIKVVLALERDFFRTYNVNYYVLGVRIEL